MCVKCIYASMYNLCNYNSMCVCICVLINITTLRMCIIKSFQAVNGAAAQEGLLLMQEIMRSTVNQGQCYVHRPQTWSNH